MSNPIFTNEKSTKSLSEFEFLHDPSDKNSKLGVGSFASVKLAKEKKTGKQYAIKMIDMHPSKITSSDLHNIRTEITIHRKLEHPNIVQFHDYIQKDHNVYLVLEYAESGNLYSYIHKKKGHLAPEEVFRFFHHTCLAIHYLHQNDVLHRDIKPENLLLDKHKNVKLCDFGWSTRRITEKRLTFCGTYEYMAPEIVYKKPYDYRVDIWSLGVLLYELIHKEAPYKGRSLPEITKSLEKSHIEFSSRTPPEAKDLILKILRTNPSDRLSIAQILAHPYVQSHLSPEDDDSLVIEEVVGVSPRELRPANTQSVYCESPKQKLRKDNENFKSEIIMTSGDGIFADLLNSKTRKNSQNHLYSSFNMPSSAKNKERSRERTQDKEKRDKSKFINIAKSLSQADGQKGQFQELVMNGLSAKLTEENLSTIRDHHRSSPSLAQKAIEKAGLEEKNIKKRKIFENTMLSPTFKSKVDNIILQLSSHTTTHKMTDRTHSLFSSKHNVPAQTPSSEVPIGFKYFDENGYYGQSSSTLRAKTDLENSRGLSTRSNNTMKNSFQKKIGLTKADTFSTLTSPVVHSTTLTTRHKPSSRGLEIGDQENNFASQQRFFAAEVTKSMTTKNFGNVLGNTDQNKFKGHDRFGSDIFLKKLQKAYDGKKKPSGKEETSSGNLHISSLSERRNEGKENKKSMIKDKENQLRLRDDYTGRWEF